MIRWWRCLLGVVIRENMRFFHQKGRFFGAPGKTTGVVAGVCRRVQGRTWCVYYSALRNLYHLRGLHSSRADWHGAVVQWHAKLAVHCL